MQAYFGLASLAAILDLVTVEDWGEKIFAERVRVKWKNGQGGRGRGRKNTPTPTLPLHQPSTGQASSYNPRWWHRTDLSSVRLRNNTCTAGYFYSLEKRLLLNCSRMRENYWSLYYETNKEAPTMPCSVVKHLGSGRALKKTIRTLDYALCFPLHFFRALPLPTCFTTEQSTVKASLFVK